MARPDTATFLLTVLTGPNAGAMIVARPTGGISLLMRMQVAAQGFPVPDVVETRLVLEAEVMRTSRPRWPV